MAKVETNRRRVVARLLREGWELVRHGGNHDAYQRRGRPDTIEVPRHRELSPGVARAIAKAAGWI